MKFELGQKWLCKDNYIMDNKSIGFKKGTVYEVLNCWNKGQSANFKSEVFDTHEMGMNDCDFLEYFQLNNPTITIEVSKIDELSDNEKLGEYVRQLKNELSQ